MLLKMRSENYTFSTASCDFTYQPFIDLSLHIVTFEGHFKLLILLNKNMENAWKTAWYNQNDDDSDDDDDDDGRSTFSLQGWHWNTDTHYHSF